MKSQEEIDREWQEVEVPNVGGEDKKDESSLNFDKLTVILAVVGFAAGLAVNGIFHLSSTYAMWIGLIVGGLVGNMIAKKKKK